MSSLVGSDLHTVGTRALASSAGDAGGGVRDNARMLRHVRARRRALASHVPCGLRVSASLSVQSRPASGAAIIIGVLLLTAFVIRLDGITTPSVESRELHNALVARQLFYGDGAGLPAWKQEVLRELGEVVRPIEPPVLDLVAAAGFRLAGGEELWIPRLVSSALWILGGIFLYLIARRLTTRPGALVALALYLLWPYGAFISRLYMPDAMMIALLLAGALTVIRYWERPSFGRLLAAGIVSGAATAAKPGVAIIFLLALFVALALSRRALVDSVTRGRLPLFVVLAALPTGLYYVYGAFLQDFLSGQSEGRIDPSLVATEWFWRGWWEMVSIALPFPQRQTYLALVPLAAGIAGVLVARGGLPRATLVALGAGYVAFAFTFTSHVPSHHYYSLPLIPILALSIGTLAGFLVERLGRRGAARVTLFAFFALAAGVAAFKAHVAVTPPAPADKIAEYQRIGKVTGHTTRALYVDVRLRSPISYWGWMVGRYWYPPTPSQDLPLSGDPFPSWVDPAEVSFLIVDLTELLTEPRLRAFTRGLPVLERTGDYAIFDVRGSRAVDAERRSRMTG
jgi:4-amino-4-deoxy-L-arabinose transferase-like glycosyltransferase